MRVSPWVRRLPTRLSGAFPAACDAPAMSACWHAGTGPADKGRALLGGRVAGAAAIARCGYAAGFVGPGAIGNRRSAISTPAWCPASRSGSRMGAAAALTPDGADVARRRLMRALSQLDGRLTYRDREGLDERA